MAISLKGIREHTILSLLFGCSFLTAGLFAAPVAVQSYVKQTDGVLFTMATGKMKLKACAGSIIRVIYTPSASFSIRQSLIVADSFSSAPDWTMDTTAATVTVHAVNLQAEVTKATGAVRFLNAAGGVLLGENPDTGKVTAVASVDAIAAAPVAPTHGCD